MTFLLNPRFQTPADKGQIRGKFQNKGRQIKGKILKNKGQIAVALVIRKLLLLEQAMTFDKAIQSASVSEEVNNCQIAMMYGSTDISVIRNRRQTSKQRYPAQSDGHKEVTSCKYCGKKHAKRQCTAYGKICNKCGKKNHFSAVCKSSVIILNDGNSVGSNDTCHLAISGGEKVTKR